MMHFIACLYHLCRPFGLLVIAYIRNCVPRDPTDQRLVLKMMWLVYLFFNDLFYTSVLKREKMLCTVSGKLYYVWMYTACIFLFFYYLIYLFCYLRMAS